MRRYRGMKFYAAPVFCFLIVGCCFAACSGSQYRNYPATVTAEKLLRIEPGMSKDMVRSILGNPFSENPETFQYTRPEAFNYPMIWIHFDSAGVREVYVKKYYIIDDPGIYGISRNSEDSSVYRWGEKALRELIR